MDSQPHERVKPRPQEPPCFRCKNPLSVWREAIISGKDSGWAITLRNQPKLFQKKNESMFLKQCWDEGAGVVNRHHLQVDGVTQVQLQRAEKWLEGRSRTVCLTIKEGGKENIATGGDRSPKKGCWWQNRLAHVQEQRKEPEVQSSLSLTVETTGCGTTQTQL